MSIHSILALALLSSVTARAARVVLPLYALELGSQSLTIGLLAASFSLLALLLSISAGKLADRFGSRVVLLFSALCGGLGMLIPYVAPGLISIFGAALLIGLSNSVSHVSLQNLVGEASGPEHRARGFSNYALMMSISNFIGPLIAGFTIDHAGYGAACGVLALLSLAPVVMLGALRASLPRTPAKAKPAAATGSVWTMLADRAVRKTLITGGLLNLGQDLYYFYLPVYMHAAGSSPSAIGIVLAANAVAMIGVRVVLPHLMARLGEQTLLAYCFFIAAVSYVLIPFSSGTFALGVVSFAFGLGMGAGQPIITLLMYNNAADGRSGEAMGLRMTVTQLTKLVGPVAFGAIASAAGLLTMFCISGVLMSLAGAISRPARAGKAPG